MCKKFLLWIERNVPPGLRFVAITVVIGIGAGAAAASLKRLLRLLNDIIMIGIEAGHPNYRFLIWPLVGILLTSIFQRWVVRKRIGHDTKILQHSLKDGDFRFSIFSIFNPLVGCGITMGLGASGGSEGPTALSAGALGSWLGQRFKLSDQWIRILLGIGAGAGIAAIFKSPMGGALYTLEVLQMELATVPVLGLICSCLVASSTAYLLSGFTFDISFGEYLPMDPNTLGWVCVLGVLAGIYSIYYTYTNTRISRFLSGLKNRWGAALLSGGMLSVAVFCFPSLFGEGFQLITRVVNGEQVNLIDYGVFGGMVGRHWVFAGLIAVLLLKGIMAGASNSGGGVSGAFVPTLFAGCVAGYLFAFAANSFFNAGLHEWYFALMGMGAVMAGTLHAPLMATFIICETTNTYAYLMPYLLAVGICYGVVKLLTPRLLGAGTYRDDLRGLESRLFRNAANKPQDRKQQ